MGRDGYSVYMGDCLLPVTPAKINVLAGGGNRSIDLADGGEINILAEPRLRQIDFSCVIPQTEYPFSSYSGRFKDAKYFLDRFGRFMESKKPFQFIVSRHRPDGRPLFSTNIKTSLESFTITEQAEDGFDITVKIKLKQYREYGVKTISIRDGGASAIISGSRPESTVRPSKPVLIGTEVIVDGRLYGSSYGDAPGQMRSNYRGKVNFINLKGSKPYHIAALDGGWLGWVSKESVKAV